MTVTTTKTTTTTNSKPAAPVPCAGSGCDERDPWPAHHVRLKGNLCALCTSCVLRSHPGSFCAVCFALVDAGSTPAAAPLAQCSKCSSVCHRSCLRSPNAGPGSDFVCVSCKRSEGFEYFPKRRVDGERRLIDINSANALLAAARIAANSMSRAAAVSRGEADRKVKEAAMSRKRARDMLYRAFVSWNGGEKGGSIASFNASTVSTNIALAKLHLREDEPKRTSEEPKKKAMKTTGGSVDHKRVQSREIEKWMRFHEPIPIALAQGVGESEKAKGGSHVDVKSKVGSVTQEEKSKKGGVLSAHSGGVVKKEGGKSMVVDMVVDGEKGRSRLPQPTQDALMSRTNPRAMFSGSQSTTSLHS